VAGMFFQCCTHGSSCLRNELACLSEAARWKDVDAQFDVIDSTFLAQVRYVLEMEGLGFEEQTVLDDYDSSDLQDIQQKEALGPDDYLDGYEPSDPKYIQQLSQSEVSALQEQLLRKQILALQGIVAQRRGLGEPPEVIEVRNHYEQVWKALAKELEMLSHDDCTSLPSTADPELDRGLTTPHSECWSPRWDDSSEAPSSCSQLSLEIPFKCSQLNETLWVDDTLKEEWWRDV